MPLPFGGAHIATSLGEVLEVFGSDPARYLASQFMDMTGVFAS